MPERTQLSQPDEALGRAVSSDAARIRTILFAAADRIERINPGAAMSERHRFTEVQLAVWDHHGVYNGAIVGRDITTTLAAVRHLPLTGSRAEYSARLRLAAGSVTL